MGIPITNKALHRADWLVRLDWQCESFAEQKGATDPKASAVFRLQCLGSAHQPPAGDHTPTERQARYWMGYEMHEQLSMQRCAPLG